AQVGGEAELERVLFRANRTGDVTATERIELVTAVEAAIRNRKIPAPEATDALRSLLGDQGAAGASAMRIAGLWKLLSHQEWLKRNSMDPKIPTELRQAACDGLALYGDADSKAFLTAVATKHPPEVRRVALIALASIDMPTAATKSAEFLTSAKPAPELVDLYAAFLSRKAGGPALAKALAGKKLDPEVAKLGLKAVRNSVQDAKALTEALTAAGGLTAARTDYTPAEVKAYVQEVLTKGDAARGEAVYRRKESTCLACHAVAGAGGQVGPDMTSIGASAQVDYLVESILIPNKAVKEGYHALKVSTLDGKVYVGIKTREADGKLYLRTSEDKEIAIAEKDIDEKAQSRSLMPDGLADQMTRQEFVDLVRFLSELGKVGPYAPNKARLVRRWQVFEATPGNMNQLRRARAAAAVEAPEAFVWATAYSKVSGEFPLDSLPRLVVWNGSEPFGMVRAQFDVTTGGKVKLRINGAAGLTLWVGSTPVEVKDETVLDMKPGLQWLTFAVDLNKRKDGLRVELEDVPGSPARVNIVGGK
ncbi:MAG: c-type cytochrome, partial [Zavarzinella sp.]|nr:c-type cytochrome [Zavarzinella sp.]